MASRSLTAAALCLALSLGGCAGQTGRSVVVEGKVTCDGYPVPAGRVSFYALADDDSTLSSRDTGTYLQTDGTFRGEAFVGPARVVVELPNIQELEEEAAGSGDEADEARQELGPARAAAALPCPLPAERRVQIVDGKNTIDIELAKRGSSESD